MRKRKYTGSSSRSKARSWRLVSNFTPPSRVGARERLGALEDIQSPVPVGNRTTIPRLPSPLLFTKLTHYPAPGSR